MKWIYFDIKCLTWECVIKVLKTSSEQHVVIKRKKEGEIEKMIKETKRRESRKQIKQRTAARRKVGLG